MGLCRVIFGFRKLLQYIGVILGIMENYSSILGLYGDSGKENGD